MVGLVVMNVDEVEGVEINGYGNWVLFEEMVKGGGGGVC